MILTDERPLEQTVSNPFFTGRLPLPPGINRSYKIVHVKRRDGQEYNRLADTEKEEQFKQDAGWQLKLARVDWALVNAIRASQRYVPLSMHIRSYVPDLWKRDIDNGEKAIIDAVFAHLELNDTLVVEKHTTKEEDKDDPRVEVQLCCLLQSK